MVVVVLGFYKRKKGLTIEQFRDHWLNVHGPLIKSIPNIEKYMIRYVQHHLYPESSHPAPSGEEAEFDGFSEGWFVDEAARDALFATSAFKDTHSDESAFLDMEATRWIVVDKQEVVIDGGGAVK